MRLGTPDHDVLQVLAQAGGQRDISSFSLWLGVLIVGVVVAGVVLMWVRRRILSDPSGTDAGAGLMANLRRMRDSGEISTQEYDAARKAMATRAAAGMAARGQGQGPDGRGRAGRLAGPVTRGVPERESDARVARTDESGPERGPETGERLDG